MRFKALAIIDTVGAGSLIVLRNVYVRYIVIEDWNYETTPDGVGALKIRPTQEPQNVIAELPADAKLTLNIEVAEQAHVFGDNETIVIQSANLDKRRSIKVKGPKGRANLRQNIILP